MRWCLPGLLLPFLVPQVLGAQPVLSERSVLVVDDSPYNRHRVASALREAGHSVIEAEDGHGALAVLASHPKAISLAFIDASMPGLSGTQLLMIMRAHPGTRSIPVVLTAHGVDDEELAIFRMAGANRILMKPLAPEKVRSEVAELLGKP